MACRAVQRPALDDAIPSSLWMVNFKNGPRTCIVARLLREFAEERPLSDAETAARNCDEFDNSATGANGARLVVFDVRPLLVVLEPHAPVRKHLLQEVACLLPEVLYRPPGIDGLGSRRRSAGLTGPRMATRRTAGSN